MKGGRMMDGEMKNFEEGRRRRERGEEGDGFDGGGEKGRWIQERDRRLLAWVGLLRVVRVEGLAALVFPGRDPATVGNRIRELARDLAPVGAYLNVHRRTKDDGSIERYVSLTEAGYQQAETVLGRGFFLRTPTEPLKPSHVQHDLDLADLAVSLFPTQPEKHQPLVKGRATGDPVTVNVPYFPKSWRCRHASIDRRLVVFEGRRNEQGAFNEKPKVALVFEPDAILETDTYNCTRYFIEFDRGTEPIAGNKEVRTIFDKLQRIRRYFWVPDRTPKKGSHWSEIPSHYRTAFQGNLLRRPKVLFVTTSPRRADNIRELAERHLSDDFTSDQLLDFIEVLPLEDARRKLRGVGRIVESTPAPAEWPWVTELRQRDLQAGSERAAARARADEEAKRSPLWVPYRVAHGGEPTKVFVLEVEEGRELVSWADGVRSRATVGDYAIAHVSMFDLLERIRAAVSPSLSQRAGALVRLATPPQPRPMTLGSYELHVILWWLSAEAVPARARAPDEPADRSVAALVTKLLFHAGADPKNWGSLILWAKARSGANSLWNADGGSAPPRKTDP
jgi:hypothetical protein